MAKRKVFYSFAYKDDVFRVQQIRNMGALEGDEPVAANVWEQIKRTDAGVKAWIDTNLLGKSCLVVLIGMETASRPLVQYEIKRAWEMGKGVFGIHIHNLSCPNTGKSTKGANPFANTRFTRNGSVIVPAVYDPSSFDAYDAIKKNMATWVESAIAQ